MSKSQQDALYLAQVESQNIRLVSYPAAWAGFNLVSDGVAVPGAWMAAYVEIVAAGVIANPCWLVGISLGLPVVEAFQADIRLAVGPALAEVDRVELPGGCNVWPVVEWNIPIIWLPKPIKILATPRLSYNIRKSTAASAAGFNICHVLALTGVGT